MGIVSGRKIYLADHLADDFGLGNLLFVGGRFDQSFSQVVDCEFSNSRSDTQRLDSFGPECLITKERLDDSWDTGWVVVSPLLQMQKLRGMQDPPRSDAPDVPAPPW